MEVELWEKLVGAVGVPAAVLFVMMFAGWRLGKWGLTYITPHIPVVVEAYRVQAEALKAQTGTLGDIKTDVQAVKSDVGEIKTGVAALVGRK